MEGEEGGLTGRREKIETVSSTIDGGIVRLEADERDFKSFYWSRFTSK